MKKTLLISAISFATLASCAPTTQVVQGVTAVPSLVKVSEGAKRGGEVSFQGRFLGGPETGRVIVGADEQGQGGFVIPTDSIKSWTDTEIVIMVPSNAPAGGSWAFVEVNGRRSTGLQFSVQQ